MKLQFPFRIERKKKVKRVKGLNPDMDFGCMVCDFDTSTEFYMVHNHLWVTAIEGLPRRTPRMVAGRIIGNELLCVGCLEKRLGRKLTAADFSVAPCNHNRAEYDTSPRLANRLAS